MKIALVSLDQRWLDKSANLSRCEELLSEIASRDCGLAIFPEMTLTGFAPGEVGVAENANDSDTLVQFGKLASRFGINIIFGACLTSDSTQQGMTPSLPRNFLCCALRDGSSQGVYAKIHPFTFAGETKHLANAKTISIITVDNVRIGCSVCYDLRFPEMFSLMADGSDVLVNIANWPQTRIDHWEALLRARAIENQVFMCGVNRVGIDGRGLAYVKSSLIFGPTGEKVSPYYSSAELDLFEVDIDSVAEYRRSFPTVKDKRFGLYRELYSQKQGEK